MRALAALLVLLVACGSDTAGSHPADAGAEPDTVDGSSAQPDAPVCGRCVQATAICWTERRVDAPEVADAYWVACDETVETSAGTRCVTHEVQPCVYDEAECQPRGCLLDYYPYCPERLTDWCEPATPCRCTELHLVPDECSSEVDEEDLLTVVCQ